MKALKILLDKDEISSDVMLMADGMYLRKRVQYRPSSGSILVTKMEVYIKVWLY